MADNRMRGKALVCGIVVARYNLDTGHCVDLKAMSSIFVSALSTLNVKGGVVGPRVLLVCPK